MIGVLLILNSRGDMILSRAFRDGLSIRALADTFKHKIVTTKLADRCPVNIIDRVAYFHMRCEGLYLVACSNTNANAMAIYQYLIRLVQLLVSFFGGDDINETNLKDHFILVQEIIDETVDFGYPQLTELDVLKSYIHTGGEDGDGSGGKSGIKGDVTKARMAEQITTKATGRIPWRNEGILYRDNEVFLDLIEEINLLMNCDGEILQYEVSGLVKFKGFLSGMPNCVIVLNDKQRNGGAGAIVGGSSINDEPSAPVTGASKYAASVELDDVSFHPCVRLGVFESNRQITFVPPDGEFILMTYRATNPQQRENPVLRVVMPRVEEVSKTRMCVDFRLKSHFPVGIKAKDITVKIPCPTNTANVAVRVKVGKAKYSPTEQAIVWLIPSIDGPEELPFSAEISLIAATLAQAETQWARPPVTIKFSAPTFAASGLACKKLTITENNLNYNAKQWVRYQTKGGQYECRLGEVKRATEGGRDETDIASA